jgi:replicative superfamily II helicase
LFKEKNFEKNDIRISLALGYIDSNKAGIVSKSEEAEMNSFFESVKIMPNSFYSDKSAIKTSYCYYCMLTGKRNMTMAGYAKNLQFDFERVAQVLYAICRVTKDFKDKKGFFTELEARVRYGVPAHLLDLCNIPNIGKVRAKKLYDFGIKSKDDFKKTDIDTLVKVINLKKSIVEDVLKSLD